MLRGSGVNFDIRKIYPYEIYEDINFSVPIGINGDCYDRYLLRIEEMRESIFIIDQVLNKLPEGFIKPLDNKIAIPSRSFMKFSMEALIHHFKIFCEGFSIPSAEIYQIVEAPKGEFGVFLVTDNTNKPYRCRIRAPGFLHLQGLDYMTRKHMIADLVTIVGTQDIVFGEIDR